MAINPDTGRPGAHTSEGMRSLWAGAANMNADLPGAPGTEWVPRRAIWVDFDILPRRVTDKDAVERYRASYLVLPPITVQAGTFKLIGGLHRLEAGEGVSDFIRIRELEVSDADIEDVAIEDNRLHGVPLSPSERIAAAKKLLARHHPDTGGTTGVAWTTERIAIWSGAHRDSVEKWRGRPADGGDQLVENLQVGPTHRLGANDKQYKIRPGKRAATGAVAARQTGALVRTETQEHRDAQASAKALDRLARAVEQADEHVTSVLDGLDPAHAAAVYEHATRMTEIWGRIADAALRLQAEAEAVA